MISKLAQMATSTTAKAILGTSAFLTIIGKECYDTTTGMKKIFERKPELPLDGTVNLDQKVVTPLSTEVQVPAISTKTEESAPTIAATVSRNTQEINKTVPSSLDPTWVKTLDWTTIAKVASVAVFTIGAVGVALMYALGKK